MPQRRVWSSPGTPRFLRLHVGHWEKVSVFWLPCGFVDGRFLCDRNLDGADVFSQVKNHPSLSENRAKQKVQAI
ncbi:MAG: hypothetical protein ACP5I4_17290, partial [Oceanipulchritudo sp.]